jgi:murein DD-endopeptidase MepM/ murein hydrolase activator NlpD
MKLKLLKVLTEEIEEQGYGRYYTDVVLSSGVKIGDTRGYNFLSGNSINKSDKVITKVLSNSSTVTYNNSGLVTLSPYKTIYPLSIKGTKSSGYGWRNHPIKRKRKHHNGIDIAVPDGTGVNSVADGEVVRADMRDYEGYGNFIIVKHDLDGETFYSAYAHLTKMLVSVGNKVKQGQQIALSGGGQGLAKGGGLSTGPHLHFEIRKTKTGGWVDPEPYLSGGGIVDGSVDETKDEEIKKDEEKIKKNEKDVKELTDKVTNDTEYSIIKSDIYKGKNVHVLFGGSHTSDYSKIKGYVKYLEPYSSISIIVITHCNNTLENVSKYVKDKFDGVVTSIAGFSQGGKETWKHADNSSLTLVGLIDPSTYETDVTFGANTYLVCDPNNWGGYKFVDEVKKRLQWYCTHKDDQKYSGHVECTKGKSHTFSGILTYFYKQYGYKI